MEKPIDFWLRAKKMPTFAGKEDIFAKNLAYFKKKLYLCTLNL